MKKCCPIVKIHLPVERGFYSRYIYCDKHSLTAEIYPMNEYQIPRLEEEALQGLAEQGCVIPDVILQYDFHEWLSNKEAYLKKINKLNNVGGDFFQAAIG